VTTPYEIPLSPRPQKFSIKLAGVSYKIRVYWNRLGACWVLDLADRHGTPLLLGIPLVTGIDLLAQHRHLGIAGSLLVQTDYAPDEVPAFDNLGTHGRLYFIAE
jgi:hypothetical protein